MLLWVENAFATESDTSLRHIFRFGDHRRDVPEGSIKANEKKIKQGSQQFSGLV